MKRVTANGAEAVTSTTVLSPLLRYERDIRENEFTFDKAQHHAIEKLDRLYHEIIGRKSQSDSMISRLLNWNTKPSNRAPLGLYLWGGVGRGKTYLMDSFFDALPIKKKKRIHFHRFMYWVHTELKTLAGTSDPLIHVAKKLADEAEVLCFDEFFVSDIGDAMILASLLEQMFKLGITLVTTSNIIPENLYRNGLQRSRFLPAIELLTKHTEVINVDGGIDYRLRTLQQAEIYHYPIDEAAEANLQFSFTHLAVDKMIENSAIVINDREIAVRAMADGVVWFTYLNACTSPRSAKDYIELSKLYHSVLLSEVPQLTDDVNDQVRRFISLVDEFYERHVKLIISSEVALEDLYKGSNLEFEFKRTMSRLQEMQSKEYLAREHLP